VYLNNLLKVAHVDRFGFDYFHNDAIHVRETVAAIRVGCVRRFRAWRPWTAYTTVARITTMSQLLMVQMVVVVVVVVMVLTASSTHSSAVAIRMLLLVTFHPTTRRSRR